MNISDRIKHIRSEVLRVNQEAFAQLLNAGAKSTVSSWETGERTPDLETLLKIAELGKVSLYWLIKGKEEIVKGRDEDPHIKYVPLADVSDEAGKLNEYPVLSLIAAGKGDLKIQDYPVWESLDYDPRKYFWLKIDDEYGFSMMPAIRPGEKLLCAWETSDKFIRHGDMVAVLYDKTKGAIKIINKNHTLPNAVVLSSLNPTEPPITLERKQVRKMFKVVLIAKI